MNQTKIQTNWDQPAWERVFTVAAKLMDTIMAEIHDPLEAYFVGTFVGEYTRHFFHHTLPMTKHERRVMAHLDKLTDKNVNILLSGFKPN